MAPAGLDSLYTYDACRRLTNAIIGDLNSDHDGMTDSWAEQTWELDETGNWTRIHGAGIKLYNGPGSHQQ